jgi:hypothetical protein
LFYGKVITDGKAELRQWLHGPLYLSAPIAGLRSRADKPTNLKNSRPRPLFSSCIGDASPSRTSSPSAAPSRAANVEDYGEHRRTEVGFKAMENYEEHGRTSPALAHVPLGSCRPLRQAALQTTIVRIKTNSCVALYHTRLLAAAHATALRIKSLACIWLSVPIDERITAKTPMRRTTGCCAKMHRIRQPCESNPLHASRFKAQGCQPPHQSTPQTTTLRVKLRSCILLGTLGRASTTATSATRGARCPLPRPLWGCAGRKERKRSQAAGVIPSRFGWHGEGRREKEGEG